MTGTMIGKTCLVTGGSTGIGRVTALALAREGANVVLVSRDEKRGTEARDEIRRQSGNDAVELILADLSSMAEVRRAAAEFMHKHDRLHVLINNAGVIVSERRLTVDGHEYTFALNHLAYFVMTELLLDVLKASAPARIINVASEASRRGHLDFDDLQGAKRFDGMRAYCNSKLANIVFTYELARRLDGTGVTANALHPGAVATSWGSTAHGFWGTAIRLARPFLLTPEQGAETMIHLATSPDVANVSGQYFEKKKPRRSIPESYDRTVQSRLWELTAALTR